MVVGGPGKDTENIPLDGLVRSEVAFELYAQPGLGPIS